MLENGLNMVCFRESFIKIWHMTLIWYIYYRLKWVLNWLKWKKIYEISEWKSNIMDSELEDWFGYVVSAWISLARSHVFRAVPELGVCWHWPQPGPRYRKRYSTAIVKNHMICSPSLKPLLRDACGLDYVVWTPPLFLSFSVCSLF